MIEAKCPFCEEKVVRSRIRELGMTKMAVHGLVNHLDRFPADDPDELPDIELNGECFSLYHLAMWKPAETASSTVTPRLEGELTCGHCGEEWVWTFRADQEEYEIECPGCDATWTTEGSDQ